MAKKPAVVCPVCKQKFFREEEEYKQDGRRYYHINCYNEKIKNEEYTNLIHAYCKKIYGDKYVKNRIDKQIKELLEDGTGKTITGIYKSLIWHYEHNNGDVEKSFGSIRIVDYVYNNAQQYYLRQWETEQRNAQLLNNIQEEQKETYYITPTPISKPKRFNLFSIN